MFTSNYAAKLQHYKEMIGQLQWLSQNNINDHIQWEKKHQHMEIRWHSNTNLMCIT